MLLWKGRIEIKQHILPQSSKIWNKNIWNLWFRYWLHVQFHCVCSWWKWYYKSYLYYCWYKYFINWSEAFWAPASQGIPLYVDNYYNSQYLALLLLRNGMNHRRRKQFSWWTVSFWQLWYCIRKMLIWKGYHLYMIRWGLRGHTEGSTGMNYYSPLLWKEALIIV